MMTLPHIHICVLQPAGYPHSMGLLDPALYMRHQMQRMGVSVTIAKNRLMHEAVNVIFGAHLGFDPALRSRYCCFFMNLEQLGSRGAKLSPAYLELLRSSAVLDYDAANVANYVDDPADVPLVSFLDAPYLRDPAVPAIPLEDRPIDVLFFGSMNERRRSLIAAVEAAGVGVTCFKGPVYGPERDEVVRQAKLVLNVHFYSAARFEQVRAFQVLSLGTPMLCERGPQTHPAAAFEDAVFWRAPERIGEFFKTEFRSPGFYARAREQLANFQTTDPVEGYADLVAFASGLWQVHTQRRSSQPWQPSRINIGSGKDYKLGWLNLDVLPKAQPDALLDLGQPMALPLAFDSNFVGAVNLAPESVDQLYANNVLEHVPDLVTFMTQALALLKTGGEFRIEVPYEHSPGAWQDPTHVRAMNEKSWLYYTDWFWYLGWFEHRFQVQQFEFLDLQLQPCDKNAAHFMRIRLVKLRTTAAERTTARTMQPDFGGLIEALHPHQALFEPAPAPSPLATEPVTETVAP
jgi:SAM-dependent methyltransferase